MNLRAYALCLAFCLAGTAAHATILAPTGAVSIVSPPTDISTGATESDTVILAFAERQNVTLPADVAADITVPGTSPSGGVQHLSPGTIAAGTGINSYFIHFDVVGTPAPTSAIPATGSVSFDSDVLGLIVLDAKLNATHTFPGMPGTTYSTGGGLEIVGGGAGTGANDQVTLSADRRTVTFNFRDAESPDDIRIITSVPEPSTLGLVFSASVGLAAYCFRRRR